MKTLNNYINEWKAKTNTISSIDNQRFIYKLDTEDIIRIFNPSWEEFNKYKNNVYLNDEHIELKTDGFTFKKFKPGTYEFEIKYLDSIDCGFMFADCKKLIKVPMFNTRKVTEMIGMFAGCENLEEVPLFNINNCNNMNQMFYNCGKLSEQTKQKWSKVYDFKKGTKKS